MQYCVIYSTCPADGNYSSLISEQLIIKKLAACVSIIDNVRSTYVWEGNLESNNEKLLIIKTKLHLFEQVKETIEKLHPYGCPEIISIPIINGNKSYLQWIENTIQNTI